VGERTQGLRYKVSGYPARIECLLLSFTTLLLLTTALSVHAKYFTEYHTAEE
jgi:hypothetical protein